MTYKACITYLMNNFVNAVTPFPVIIANNKARHKLQRALANK